MLEDAERKLLAALDREALVTLLVDLVRAPSVSGEEKRAVERLAAFFEEEGFAVTLEDAAPGRPNLVCEWGSADGPTLLLTGHSDTVPIGEGWSYDPFGAAIENGRLYGRGSCDMKAGLAGMAIALATLKEHLRSPRGRVVFAACVDEEVGGLGTQAAIKAGLAADWAVIGEPTELQPIRACKGNCYFEVEITGKAAHAASPDRGVNAIYGAATAIRAAQLHDQELRRRMHALLGSPTLNVGTITGGMTASAVPDRCTLGVDRRLLPNETGESALADFRQALREHLQGPEGLGHSAELRMELPASEVEEGHPLVRALAEAAVDGGAPKLPVGGWAAASDGGYLMRDARIPTVLFGPGSILNQAHRPNEYVPLDEVMIAARTYLLMGMRAVGDGLGANRTARAAQ